jgi:hypothetical protein
MANVKSITIDICLIEQNSPYNQWYQWFRYQLKKSWIKLQTLFLNSLKCNEIKIRSDF